MLEDAILQLLGSRPEILFSGVKDHPLVRAIAHSRSKMPSYIPSSTFSLALFDTLVPSSGGGPLTVERLRDAILKLPGSCREALLALVNAAEGNLATARTNVEHWFDCAMDRLSGAYKRHVNVWLFSLGFVLAAATNADTILLVQRLEHEGALRASVTAQVAHVDTAGQKLEIDRMQLEQMELLFWDTDRLVTADEAKQYPRAARQPEWSLSWMQWLLFKIIGCVMTALAVSLGAPFWFDLLGRLVNLRATGARPAQGADGARAKPQPSQAGDPGDR